MPTLHRLDEKGGFTVADTAEHITAYAEPTSRNATEAARDGGKRAGMICDEMIAIEELRRWHGLSPAQVKETALADDRAMSRLHHGRMDGSTKEDPDDSRDAYVREGRQEARFVADRHIDDVRGARGLSYDPNKAGSQAQWEQHEQRDIAATRREVPYPIFYCQENQRWEDRSITGSLISGLDTKLQAQDREIFHHSPHLSPAEKTEATGQNFSHHIKAWDRPAMALSKRLDGDKDHLVHVPWERDDNDHER